MSSFFEDRKARVMRGYHKAIDMYENMETVGSRYIYEVDERRATYVQEDNFFVRAVVEVPVIESPPPPTYYDFIKGIVHMRDGGKCPDWGGCEKAHPIRVTDFSRPLRAKYEAALASKWKPDVLYNPSHLTLRMYPDIPVHYSGSQSWHKEMMKDPTRTYFYGDLSKVKCHVSFDTIGKDLPPVWTGLIPHPQLFKDTYPDGMIEWDGQSIRYTWTTSRMHSVVLTPKDWYYYTTAQTDLLLENSQTKFSASQAYWLYSSIPFPSKAVSRSYRPSYTIPTYYESDKSLSYYSVKGEEGSTVKGYVDLDQVMCKVHYVSNPEVEIYLDTRKIDLEPSQEGVRDSKPLIFLYEGRRKGTYISEMGFTLKSVPAYVIGNVTHPAVLHRDGLLAVSDTPHLLYEHLLSLYFKHRHKVFTRQIDRMPGLTVIIPESYQYYPLVKLVEYMSQKIGPVTASQVKAMVRHQGGMIIRTKIDGIRDRYVMEASIPGVSNSREIWSYIHSHRTSFVRVEGVLPLSVRAQFQNVMFVNGLVSWYNYAREEFVVSDPHSLSNCNGSVPLKLLEYQSPVYATSEGVNYYYPDRIAYREDVEAYYYDLLGDVPVYGIDDLPLLPEESKQYMHVDPVLGDIVSHDTPSSNFFEFFDEDEFNSE